MEVLRIETDNSGTAIKPETRGSYETGKRGAWKNGMSDLMLTLKEA